MSEGESPGDRERGDRMISVWPGISSRKHVGIIDSEPYCILCYLFCSTIINAAAVFRIKYLYTPFLFSYFFGIVFHTHSQFRYSCAFLELILMCLAILIISIGAVLVKGGVFLL